MRTTAGVKVPLSSLLATGAEVAIFLGAGTLRVGGAFGLLSGCRVISFPCSKSLTCFSRDSISSAIAAARVVPCHDFLTRDVDGHDPQIHPHHAIDDRDEENQSGPFCAEQLAETKNHPALVLAQDADHLRQDDHGEQNNRDYPDE